MCSMFWNLSRMTTRWRNAPRCWLTPRGWLLKEPHSYAALMYPQTLHTLSRKTQILNKQESFQSASIALRGPRPATTGFMQSLRGFIEGVPLEAHEKRIGKSICRATCMCSLLACLCTYNTCRCNNTCMLHAKLNMGSNINKYIHVCTMSRIYINYLSTSLSLYLSVCLSVWLPVCLPVCLSGWLSICLSFFLFVYLHTRL